MSVARLRMLAFLGFGLLTLFLIGQSLAQSSGPLTKKTAKGVLIHDRLRDR